MAIIPSGQKFHTVSSNVYTENKGSAQVNSGREMFTMKDITDSIVSAYTSSFIKVSQSGTGEPTFSFISNEAGLVLGTATSTRTGQYSFTFTGTPPDEDNVMIVLPGGLQNSDWSYITLVSKYRNSGQLFINTYGVNGSGALIPTDIGSGGSNSFAVEIKVFS